MPGPEFIAQFRVAPLVTRSMPVVGKPSRV